MIGITGAPCLQPASSGPVGLYVHVPFCERKCHYCDFNSGVHVPEMRARYVAALVREIQYTPLAGRSARSVFFGGGTPSVLPAPAIAQILAALRSRFVFPPAIEITVECNPGTIASERMAGETTEAFLAGIRNAGVNRLSFGVQSLDDGLLKTLGRIHSPEQAIQSIRHAQDTGFENINVDVMFALPGQSPAQWAHTLNGVIALGVPHISAYSLIVEPDTPFALWDAEARLERPSEDDEAEMYEAAIATLTGAGYEHYEVSAFARPGHRCVQNTVYWRNEEYIGFGNGAASYIAGERFTREPGLETYVQLAETGEDTVAGRERLNERGGMGETMMMGLRMLDGVNRAHFIERFGGDCGGVFREEITRLEDAGLLSVSAESVKLTHRGLFLANEVWESFV